MNKSAVLTVILAGFCGACNPEHREQANIRLQIRISGTGLATIKSEVSSKGKQGFLMFNDPAQVMSFRNQDTINYLFPIGKKDVAGHFDTIHITRKETLVLAIKIAENKLAGRPTSAAKPHLRVELLADNKVVQSVQLPAIPPAGGKPTAQDSAATLTFHTDTL
ncbi:hypothetical protein QMK33_19010 [Hymenobacter sp. H14-R3]|uniref:hypothetical protein n=1 Tax=Hymenobacter sp. H14-R3 TaxID=3046308 RepID=UPI0024B8B23D|nr:hypothetical protein [Hymenobacter sp. H14-R3]MDJ0367244.1 hypothetical protein [Hymenobacter sp. H14-R3]